jgi:uncharacterized protein
MRIGVIGDTHIPTHQPALPRQLRHVFSSVDIILHAGDVCTLATLRELQDSFAITMAVCGERDQEDVRRYLEPHRVVEFGGRRIAMTHGCSPQRLPWWRRLLRLASSATDEEVQSRVLSDFTDVDCIVYGHTHRPYVQWHGAVLLFNPGAAAYIDGQRPTVGLLEVDKASISGHIIHLEEL